MAKAKKKDGDEKGAPQPPVVALEGDQKREAFLLQLAEIEKKHGKGSIMLLTDEEIADTSIPHVATNIFELDNALGIGGLPRGRVVEIYGPEMSGKTTLTLHLIAEVQRLGGIAAFVDAEHSLDNTHAANCGVRVSELAISQPDTGEEALDIVDALVRSGAVDIIVIDSVAALVPKAELTGEMGDAHMGLQARLMSQALRKLTGIVAKSNTLVIFLNQIRMKIGVMFGNPETTTGGNALKFYASVRLDMRRIETIEQNGEPVANRVRVKVVKNKVAPPFKKAEFVMYYDAKKTIAASCLEFGAKVGVVKKSGAFYTYNDERVGQGFANAVNFLIEHPEMLEQIRTGCQENLYNTPVATLADVI